MSREAKRVPFGFSWPMGEAWWGYVLEPVLCQTCSGSGIVEVGAYCWTCEGEGKAWPRIDPPVGTGWQMWETTSEGSPVSPVCSSAEQLARWLVDSGASAFGSFTATYEEWMRVAKPGWTHASQRDYCARPGSLPGLCSSGCPRCSVWRGDAAKAKEER